MHLLKESVSLLLSWLVVVEDLGLGGLLQSMKTATSPGLAVCSSACMQALLMEYATMQMSMALSEHVMSLSGCRHGVNISFQAVLNMQPCELMSVVEIFTNKVSDARKEHGGL